MIIIPHQKIYTTTPASVKMRMVATLSAYSTTLFLLFTSPSLASFHSSPFQINNNSNSNNSNNKDNKMSLRKIKPSSAPVASPPSYLNPQPTTTTARSLMAMVDPAPFRTSTSILAIANMIGCLISVLTHSHLHIDLIGTGAFALVGLYPILFAADVATTGNGRILWSSAAVTAWGTKLASFLFYRALVLQHDARLTSTLSTATGMVAFWTISFVWGLVCSLPHTLGTMSAAPAQSTPTVLGILLFAVGMVIETLADAQKWRFKATHPAGQYCNVGLWSMSQHPNFFGNLVLWAGIFILNLPALVRSKRILALALLGPMFMTTLFYGQATGRVTDAVQMAAARYANQVGYAQYIAETPLIVPNFLWTKR
jgi:steroid 5-alpha reductase family enzyme